MGGMETVTHLSNGTQHTFFLIQLRLGLLGRTSYKLLWGKTGNTDPCLLFWMNFNARRSWSSLILTYMVYCFLQKDISLYTRDT